MTVQPQSLRVLVVDDNAILCAGIERWLLREPGIASVKCQPDWHKAESDARAHQPDIVLLDIDMPGMSGLDLIAPLLAVRPQCKIIIFSGLVTRVLVERALDNGACGYLVKDQETRTIADIIHKVAAGSIALCPTTEVALAGK